MESNKEIQGEARLRDLLLGETQERGIVSFGEFMRMALYDPSIGYYESAANPIGKEGDYITSVSVGPMFGKLLGWRIANWIDSMRNPVIVEGGAHDGQLAHDILSWMESAKPELHERLQFFILEPSAKRRALQGEKLAQFAGRISWIKSWAEVSERGLQGVILSNELLDAFPVRRLAWKKVPGRWVELGVTWRGGRFAWGEMELSEEPGALWPRLKELPQEMLEALPDGFIIDISPEAVRWWRDAANRLIEGFLITFDYGLTYDEMLLPERQDGTLRGYYQHQLEPDPLARPGEQDLTAHVDFSSIIQAGQDQGCATIVFETQGRFLTKILEAAVNANEPLFNGDKDRRQFLTLIHPEGLGAKFRVLAQEKSIHYSGNR